MKILIATDATRQGGAAVRAAARRKWVGPTELRVVTVLPQIAEQFPELAERAQQLSGDTRVALAKMAMEAADLLKGKGRAVTFTIRHGHVAEEIVAEAKKWKADLVMVGSHDRPRISQFFLGSVAQRVAATAHCSVEVVRESARRR